MEQTKKPLPGAVLLLAALGFVLGTCEFVIVGILPEIAEGLNTSLAAVGKLVSVFAACYAVGTPVITAATGGISRRKLLAVLMGVFLLTSAASFAAPNVAVLYATRVVAALVSGTLTAVAMLYAKEVAAPEQTARAISLVYGGFSVAAVLGVPLGTAVCQILGWRWTFAVILAMGAALLPLLLRSLPAVPAQADSGLLKSFSILWDPRCSLCVGMILCSASATYIVYTYLSPILTETLGLPAGAVSPLLLVMGACSAASNLLSGRLGERGGLRTLPMAFAAQAVLFALLNQLPQGWLGFEGTHLAALPAAWYKPNLFWLGLPDLTVFSSSDYFPLLPWVFLYWVGYFFARWFRARCTAQPGLPPKALRPLCAVGSRTLLIYMLHQPVIYGALLGLRYLGFV